MRRCMGRSSVPLFWMGRVVVGAYREAVSCVEARMGVVAFPFKGTCVVV